MARPFKGPGRMTLTQWRALHPQPLKPVKAKPEKKPKAELRRFRVILPELTAKQNAVDKYLFECYTRSEARGAFKARFNCGIPAGTVFKEINSAKRKGA